MEAVEVADLLEIPRRKYIYRGGIHFWKLIGLILSHPVGNEVVKSKGEDFRQLIKTAIEAVDGEQ